MATKTGSEVAVTGDYANAFRVMPGEVEVQTVQYHVTVPKKQTTMEGRVEIPYMVKVCALQMGTDVISVKPTKDGEGLRIKTNTHGDTRTAQAIYTIGAGVRVIYEGLAALFGSTNRNAVQHTGMPEEAKNALDAAVTRYHAEKNLLSSKVDAIPAGEAVVKKQILTVEDGKVVSKAAPLDTVVDATFEDLQ